MTRFQDKIVLVAGSSRPPGIGAATAMRLASEGATLACVDRVLANGDGGTDSATPDEVTSLQEQLLAMGANSCAIDADIAFSAEAERVVTQVVATYGRIDVCLCLTGTTGPMAGLGELATLTDDSWNCSISRNLSAPFFLARAVAAQMRSQGGGGALTFLSSYAGVHPTLDGGGLGVARAALNFLVTVLASELGPDGIRVNAVCPLGIESPANPALHALMGTHDEDQASWIRANIPLGRLQSAKETAATLAYLSSDDASFVSGQSVTVAGGAFR